ncbi:MAG: hypothetical protein IPJ94_22815 [Chloroflexi bacterium]|nr:hypothetical protein [Chloroflexota bacterium]
MFEVKKAKKGNGPDGTVNRQGATCLACKNAVPFDHIRDEGKAGRMSAQLMAIVTEGQNGRNYHAPTSEHEAAAQVAIPANVPDTDLPEQALGFRVQLYGMTKHRDLFTPRQLTALTTFSDLVTEARAQIQADALAVGLSSDCIPFRNGGAGAMAYAEALSSYLALAYSNSTNYNSTLCGWNVSNENVKNTFSRQALPMTWDFAENHLLKGKLTVSAFVEWIALVLESYSINNKLSFSTQQDAVQPFNFENIVLCTDPPYYDNIGYADLADFLRLVADAAQITFSGSLFYITCSKRT